MWVTRWSSIRGTVGSIVVALLAACGSGDSGETLEPVFQDEARCLNCGSTRDQEETNIIEPSSHMAIAPEQLMFYPTSENSPEFDPKEIIVTNRTHGLVLITNTFLANDPWAPGGSEGVVYFETDPFEDKIELLEGQSARFWVRFLGSSRQRSAVFVVHTTDLEYGSISSSLTGKYFQGTGS